MNWSDELKAMFGDPLPEIVFDHRAEDALRGTRHPHYESELWRREVWVYFLQGEDGGPVKIGRSSRDPTTRIQHAQLGYPFSRLRLVGVMRGPFRFERTLHDRFRKSRLMGEWFSPSPDLREFILSLRSNP